MKSWAKIFKELLLYRSPGATEPVVETDTVVLVVQYAGKKGGKWYFHAHSGFGIQVFLSEPKI